LTYYERQSLITEALCEAGLDRREFAVIPFPIETPHILGEFLPKDVPVLTTVCEPWNRVKVETLQRVGYKVEVLWERDYKSVSGHEVRELIARRDLAYMSLVPAATVKMIEALEAWNRLD
jgi:nicotinamide mononucleotide adenylyltransferase